MVGSRSIGVQVVAETVHRLGVQRQDVRLWELQDAPDLLARQLLAVIPREHQRLRFGSGGHELRHRLLEILTSPCFSRVLAHQRCPSPVRCHGRNGVARQPRVGSGMMTVSGGVPSEP